MAGMETRRIKITELMSALIYYLESGTLYVDITIINDKTIKLSKSEPLDEDINYIA